MTPAQLRRRIKRLPADTPLHKALEKELGEGVGFGRAWYGSQKEHWLGWLAEYDGAGAYGRNAATSTKEAAYVWNHIQCAPMLFWLAEALDMPNSDLATVFRAVIGDHRNGAARCKILRHTFHWDRIETALVDKSPGPLVRIFR